MTSSLDLAIRTRLARYLAGDLPLRAFEEWFVLQTWNVRKNDNPAAIDLTYTIELLLSEYSSGTLSEEELRDELRPCVTNYESRYTPGERETFHTTTGTSARTAEQKVNFPTENPVFTVQEVRQPILAGT